MRRYDYKLHVDSNHQDLLLKISFREHVGKFDCSFATIMEVEKNDGKWCSFSFGRFAATSPPLESSPDPAVPLP